MKNSDRICIVCLEKIEEVDNYTIIALDRPYLNCFVHVKCFKENEDNIMDYVEKYVKNRTFSAKNRKV